MNSKQLREHVESGDGYLVINGKVIDVSDFIEEHPGGSQVLLENIGKDATEQFREVGHSEYAHMMLDDFYVCEYEPSLCARLKKKLSAYKEQIVYYVKHNVPACVQVTLALSLGALAVVLIKKKL